MSEPCYKHDYAFGHNDEVLVASTRPLPQWALTALRVHFSPRNYPDPQLKFPFMGEDEGPDISRMEKPSVCHKTGALICPVCEALNYGGIHLSPDGESCDNYYENGAWKTLRVG